MKKFRLKKSYRINKQIKPRSNDTSSRGTLRKSFPRKGTLKDTGRRREWGKERERERRSIRAGALSLLIPRSIVSRYKLCQLSLVIQGSPISRRNTNSPWFPPLYFFRPLSYGRHLRAYRLYVARPSYTNDNPQRSNGYKPPCAHPSLFLTRFPPGATSSLGRKQEEVRLSS